MLALHAGCRCALCWAPTLYSYAPPSMAMRAQVRQLQLGRGSSVRDLDCIGYRGKLQLHRAHLMRGLGCIGAVKGNCSSTGACLLKGLGCSGKETAAAHRLVL